MVSMNHFLAFAAVAVVIVAIPGPSALFTISRALTVGRRAALVTVTGNAVGIYLQVVATAFGVGALVQHSATAFTMLKFVGAGYLVYLGVQAFRHRQSMLEPSHRHVVPVRSFRALRDGVVVGVTNPKSIVVFVAVMPGFADPTAGQLPLQLLILGALFPAIGLLIDGLWAIAAGTAREWLARSPRWLARIGGTSGLLMIGLGTGLAFTGRKD